MKKINVDQSARAGPRHSPRRCFSLFRRGEDGQLAAQTQSKIHKYLIKVRYFCASARAERRARFYSHPTTCEIVTLACL